MGGAARALRADPGVIYRHLDALIQGLERPLDGPPFRLVGRLRHLMFKDCPLSPPQPEFITGALLTDKVKTSFTPMRYSGILEEQIAARIGQPDRPEQTRAFAAARDNLANLREFLDTLNLRDPGLAPPLPVALAQTVDKRLSDGKRHEG